jgi:MFS family permease
VQPIRDNARVLAAATAGTTVEYYDFFIFGTAAALVFGPLFFPSDSSAAQTMAAFLSFGIAFLARPFGAVLFGHFGDRVGRKSTLVATLLLMGLSTLAIAFLPTYAMAGWIAPALLCLMRLGQGLALGGEWGGAALLAVENAPAGWAARFSSTMQLGSPIGLFAATAVFLVLGLTLSDAEFTSWGWRVPFLASAVLVVLGLWVRLKIEETPAFRTALASESPVRVPVVEVFRDHAGPLLAGCAGIVVIFALFYLTTAWALAYGTGKLGYPREELLAGQLIAALCYAGGILIGGTVADRIGAGRTMAIAAAATIPVGLVFGPGLSAGSLELAVATLCLAMFVLGFANGPQGAWLAGLYPVRLRYTAVSLAFNIGGIVGGALTPLAAQAMSEAGWGAQSGLLLSLAGLITLLGIRMGKPHPE